MEKELNDMMLKSIMKDKPVDKFVDEVFSEFKVENVEKLVSKASDIKENLEKKGMKLTPAIMSLALCAGPDGFMRFYEKSKTFKIWSALLDQNSPINSLRIVHIGERAMTTLYNTREEVAQEYNELLAKHYQSLLMEHKDEGKPKTKSSKKKQCLRNPPLLNHPTTARLRHLLIHHPRKWRLQQHHLLHINLLTLKHPTTTIFLMNSRLRLLKE